MAQIVTIGERRLLDGGYDALSVAAVARELGLAQNAIYWYFPSKNHLFVAALEHMLQGIAARKLPEMGIDQRILWFADEAAELFGLRSAMYEQARQSPVVADFAVRLDSVVGHMLGNALRGRVPDEDLGEAVEALRATILGSYVQMLDASSRRRVLTFTVGRLTG